MAADGGGLDTFGEVEFLNFRFTKLSRREAAEAVSKRARRMAPFGYVVTPNADHVVKRARQSQRAKLYDGAWLTLNDSRVLRGLARISGVGLPLAPGSDLVGDLLEQGYIDADTPITLIAAEPAQADALRRKYFLRDVRFHCPPQGLAGNRAALEAAAAFAAAQKTPYTFLCVGAPQQEMIAYAMAQRGDCIGVGLCVGAAVDFLTGRQLRAPWPVRVIGMEWLFRLMSNPARMWRRYLVDGPAVFGVWFSWLANRAASRSEIAARSAR
jgi:N-acetylglucosaminyldiphosphoundecaprenol N-acetyl-beta-D-mannosaminyltransferase